MDIVALRAELTNDPLSRSYSTMSDSQASDSLNARNRSAPKIITAQTLHSWFVFNGKWSAILATGAGAPVSGGLTANQKLAAESFIEICHYFKELDMRIPLYANGIIFILDEFLSRGIISSAQRSEVIALGSGFISRAEELGLGYVTYEHVGISRQITA